METDKRVETLESEFKLMKGELKQTLASVRDYLLNLKLPPSQEATLLAAAMEGGSSEMSMDGKFAVESSAGTQAIPRKNELPANEAKGELEPEAELADETGESEEETGESEEGRETAEGQGEPIDDTETKESRADMGLSVPPVNLLANLIRWVSNAKKGVGGEQLATLLEVYGISGHLSPELKEVILHMADIAAEETTDASAAEIWSRLLLELNGILTGGYAPIHSLRTSWTGVEAARRAEKEKPKHKPLKLKLVLSDSDGKDKEFSVDLKPDE